MTINFNLMQINQHPGIETDPGFYQEEYGQLQPFLLPGIIVSDITKIEDVNPPKRKEFLKTCAYLARRILQDYRSAILVVLFEVNGSRLPPRRFRGEMLWVFGSDESPRNMDLLVLDRMKCFTNGEKTISHVFKLCSMKGWYKSETPVIDKEIKIHFLMCRNDRIKRKDKEKLELKSVKAEQVYQEILTDCETKTPEQPKKQKQSSLTALNQGQIAILSEQNEQSLPGNEVGILQTTAFVDQSIQSEEIAIIHPSVSIVTEKILTLNEPRFSSRFFLHTRIMRWRTNHFAAIRKFTDFDRTANCTIQKYANCTDDELYNWKARHNLSGIERLLSDQELQDTYSVPYQFQDTIGDIHGGRRFACTMQMGNEIINGYIKVAIDDRNYIYHAMFEEAHENQSMVLLPHDNHEEAYEDVDRNNGWELAANYQFDLLEDQKIQMWIQNGENRDNVIFTFYPNVLH